MRLAYHVIDMPAEDVKQLAAALSGAKEQIHYCSRCFNLTDSDVCEICRDSSRDSFTICVVEQPQDIAAMERSHGYHGLYHVLHGVLSPLDGIGPESCASESFSCDCSRNRSVKLLLRPTRM